MTTITGTIVDSGGQALTGRLIVKLDAPLVDTSTEPYTTHLPATREFAITNGAVNLTLLQTQTSGITYHFIFNTYEIIELFYLVDGALYSGPNHLHTDGAYYTGNTHTADSVLLNRETREQSTTHINFHAVVPNVLTEDFASLLPTGVTTDLLDTAAQRIANILVNNLDYAEALRGGPRPRGEFDPDTYYKLDDQVSHDGSSYTWINESPAKGVYPPNITYWQVNALKGDTGTGTAGNNTAYDATTWDGQLDAPSRNAVRDVIELLATKAALNLKADINSPVLTGIPSAPTPATGNRGTQIATTGFVGAEINLLGTVPVGAILPWVTGSAPTRWLICDGRTISRATYAALFAVLGTSFGAGDGSTTFHIPDLRGRVIAGLDNAGTAQGDGGRISGAWADTVGGSGGSELQGMYTSNLEGLGYGLVTPGQAFTDRVIVANDINKTLSSLQPTLALNYIIYAGVI